MLAWPSLASLSLFSLCVCRPRCPELPIHIYGGSRKSTHAHGVGSRIKTAECPNRLRKLIHRGLYPSASPTNRPSRETQRGSTEITKGLRLLMRSDHWGGDGTVSARPPARVPSRQHGTAVLRVFASRRLQDLACFVMRRLCGFCVSLALLGLLGSSRSHESVCLQQQQNGGRLLKEEPGSPHGPGLPA